MSDVYLRPTGFVDAPFGLDGRVARLAGGLLWFSAVEVIRWSGGTRASELVAVADLPAAIRGEAGAELAWGRITSPRAPLVLGERTVRLDQPQVMAILNVTPDSFSDGGKLDADPAAAAAAGVQMAADGAAIVDLGGESTRPGAKPVWEGDEIARTLPVVERLARGGVAVSIDTRKGAVMAAALGAGAGIVNDVSALGFDDRAAEIVARAGCPVVLMHHQGDPQTMQKDPRYNDALLEVYDWLEARIVRAEAAGIDRAKILIDPGIGFGKALRHNLALLNGLTLFHGLGCGPRAGREPQANDRRALQRSARGEAPRRIDRAGADGRGAGRATAACARRV